MEQGDTPSTRTGNTICVKEISLYGIFQRNATDFAADAYVRMAIVQDLQQVADTAPTAAQIFADTTQPWAAAPGVEHLGRFKVLWMSPVYDMWRMRCDSDTLAAGAVTQSTVVDVSLKTNIIVSFNSTAATDIQKNGIYLVWISSVATADWTGFSRCGFTDV